MSRPKPIAPLPAVPGWPPDRIAEMLPSPASKRDADCARFWIDLDTPIDPARLPMRVQTKRPGVARRAGKGKLLAAAALALLLGAGYRFLWPDLQAHEAALAVFGLPSVLALFAAALLWSVRGQPDSMRIELTDRQVRYETPKTSWELPLSAYAGLALRRRLIRDGSRLQNRHYTPAERAAGMHRRVERWWIELVHEDPARRLVLWSSEQPFDEGLERVEALAAALRLPILTTSNRYWVADSEEPDWQDARPSTGDRRPAAAGRGAQGKPRQRLDAAASRASGIPKLIALGVILPLVGGMAWLTWTVAQETRTVLRTWQPVEVTVLDKSGSDTMRLAIESGGTRRETEVPRSTDLKAFGVGERFPAYADPNNPDMLRPATGGALWGGVGMLAFFTLAFAGVGIFLLRSGSPAR
ncbi:MAG: DUF3592 domain-containing protein [Betaproteobacteria bacterium]|nr:DUF3592 domain-containing protein [Betaproteobacteria bacterium]